MRRAERSGRARRAAAGAALLAAVAGAAGLPAQSPDPRADWRTLRTAHFDVHFTPELEEPARRAAGAAERAYAQLAAELVRPRGRVDLVVSDNVDFSNGLATPFPSNRITVFAHPPLSTASLRFYDDWLALVITHELAHIFHLDRARGWWRAAQRVFGRNPLLMPNLYTPAWVVEGLATYYESALTGAGRVRGSHERMVVEASALARDLPRISELSAATSRFPGGEIPYAYGALFFDHLARAHGPESVPRFVERTSGAAIPFRLNRAARESFGVSFAEAWRRWQDSLRGAVAGRRALPLEGWRDLTREGRLAFYPRWTDTSSLVFTGSTGRETPGAYRVDTRGRITRLGRRNSLDASVPMADGALLFAQLDFVSPFELRSDLFVQRDGRQRRLTRGARLSEPDVRGDGEIVAVRTAVATNRLVRVSADGRRVVPITSAALDTQWAEPRWSPRGDRIAVTRWTRGGYADVVVLDSTGALVAELTRDRAVDSSPSWSPDGRTVVFTSDRTGIADVYAAVVDDTGAVDGAAAPRRLSRAATGLFYPTLSPDASSLAAVRFLSDGWHVGVAPFDSAEADRPAPQPALGPADTAPAPREGGRARRYSPWRTLVPRYWIPLVGQTASGGASLGAATSGSDVIGLHGFAAHVFADPREAEHEWSAGYGYAGFGQPLVDVSASQEWSRFALGGPDAGTPAGFLRRRTRVGAVALTVRRPRVRTSAFATIGAEVERRSYSTDPAPLFGSLPAGFRAELEYRSLVAGAGWTNARRPELSISPEDGVSLSASMRTRWLRGEAGVASEQVTAVSSLYKSLDLPGYAHHVVALRAAGGYASGRVRGEFDVGGTSGAPGTIIPGVSVGGRQTFGVRGFPPGARFGRRALAASLEYRAPLARLGRGIGLWPLFLDRSSVTVFGDAGAADDARLSSPVPAGAWLASVGAELILDAALQYDTPYRFRLGAAAPVLDHSVLRTRPVTVYVTLGTSF